MKPLNLGIIGCGVIGKKHAQAAAETDKIHLTALADINKEAASSLAEELNVKNAFESGDALIESANVEAVVLALPAGVRLKLALSAFQNNKHVLTEKPVGMCVSEVEKMISASGNLTVGCCSSRMRFLENAFVASDFIRKGNLGRIRSIRCSAFSPAPEKPETLPPSWRLQKHVNGGGVLANWGCYDMDYLLGILDWRPEPVSVYGRVWQIPEDFKGHVVDESNAETQVSAVIRFKDGGIMNFERGEYTTLEQSGTWQINGEKGSLDLPMVPWIKQGIRFFKADPQKGCVEEAIWDGKDTFAAVPRRLLEDFAAAVFERRQPRTSLENALVVQKITDGIYKSSETGQAVEIN